jgi:16S rRNA processing protein RimM
MKKDINKIHLVTNGFISKPHGFDGELILAFRTGEAEDYVKVNFIFIEIEGKPVPFSVEGIRSHKNDIVVKLEDVNSEAEAKKLTGKKIFIEEDETLTIDDDDVNWDSLVGYKIVEAAHGTLGKLEKIEEYPQQLIAHCIVNGKEVLFPLNEDFISKIDRKKKELHLQLPEGLLDVYLK